MNTAFKWMLAAVVFIVVAGFAGFSEFAGIVVMFGLLLGIMFLAVPGLRPRRRDGTPLTARRITFLGRYGSESPVESPAAILVAAFAVWAVLELLEAGLAVAVFFAMVLAVAYVIFPNTVAGIGAVAGSVAVTISLFMTRPGCADTGSARGIGLYLFGIVTAVVVFLLVSKRILTFLPRPLSGTTPPAMWALLVFGLLDVVAFITRPGGIEVWSGAPGWAPFLALLFVVVLAVLASYGPGIVLALVAIGLAVGSLMIAALTNSYVGPEACGRPFDTLVFVSVFLFLGVWLFGFRDPARR